MPKRISRRTKQNDVNQLAADIVRQATTEVEGEKLDKQLISKIMAEMGRKGGKKGGKRRLKTLSPEERTRIALHAAKARWSKKRPPKS